MKRGLVFSLCALALAAHSGRAMAQTVGVSLNLRYNDPADPTEGGTWTLVGKVNSPGTTKGIAAVNAYLNNINTAGIAFAAGTNQLSGGPFFTPVTGGTNILYGQDTSSGTVVLNLGNGVTAPDVLKNPAWDNSVVLVTGTFGTTRPVFITSGTNSTGTNVFTATATTTTPEAVGAVTAGTLTAGSPIVRGDSVISFGLNSNPAAGLRRGDFTRDFAVNGLDLAILAANFNGTGKTWDQGDSNDDGNVNGLDLADLASNFNLSSPSPITAVPEPCSVALAALAFGGFGIMSRRKR